MSNQCLVLPVTHFWVLQTKDLCVPAFLINNDSAASSEPDFVVVKAALQQPALHMFACCVGAQSGPTL